MSWLGLWQPRGIAAVMICIGLAVPLRADARGDENEQEDEAKYLFICAGDQARSAPDFLAVINFDQNSRDYGRVIGTAPFPVPDASGNEPHHIGLSSNGRVVACGGLLSVLKGQKEVFFFDVSNPRAPRSLASADPPLSAITDEFHALPNGGFLVTMMGGAQGHAPGRVAEFDRHLDLVREHPENKPEDGFNPHGISVREELNPMVTSDFVCPSTTLDAVHGDVDFRSSIRVWDYRCREIRRTTPIPGAGGTIDVQLLPHDRQARAYTAGMLNDRLYITDTRHGSATPVFDFASISAGGWPQLMRVSADGKRLFISMNQAGKSAMFDISRPEEPRLLKVLDLGSASGPDYIHLTKDGRRLVVDDYFLNEDSFGKVHAEGDHKIHVAPAAWPLSPAQPAGWVAPRRLGCTNVAHRLPSTFAVRSGRNRWRARSVTTCLPSRAMSPPQASLRRSSGRRLSGEEEQARKLERGRPTQRIAI